MASTCMWEGRLNKQGPGNRMGVAEMKFNECFFGFGQGAVREFVTLAIETERWQGPGNGIGVTECFFGLGREQ